MSLLTSKDEMKIRLQSDVLSAIWPCLAELCSVLEKGEYKVVYQDRLPLKELDAAIDVHFECRQNLKKLKAELDNSTLQFRMI